MQLKETYTSFIDGAFSGAIHGEPIPVLNPANGETIAMLGYADTDELDRAVAAGQKAFFQWEKTSAKERASILNRMADCMDANKERLGRIEAMDVGKPIGEAILQMGMCADMYRYFAAAILSKDDVLVCHEGGSMSAVVREPLGVVGLILPWNAPSMLLSWKLAPALAAGNCAIVKPASVAPLVVLELAELWASILPAGVLNIVVGHVHEIGDAFVRHPGISKLSFTGSTAVGRQIGGAAGERIIPCTLELGGKSAVVVFDDANLDRALQMTALGILSSNGQVCVAGSRVFVQSGIYDAFLNRMVEIFKGIRIGDPQDPEIQMGPIVDDRQLNSVLRYIECGKAEGARLLCGGVRLTEGAYSKGNFVTPTIFADVKPDMRIAREEIFGPVLCISRFETEEEALQLANDSEYGLGGAVWTQDFSRALRVSRSIQAGTVWINDYLDSSPGNPFGGYKNSGLGREIHKMALDQYSNVKNIVLNPDTSVPSLF